jgi:hypothetical protein
VSSQQTGCPTSGYELSTSGSSVSTPTNLNSIQTIGGNEVVTATDEDLHQAYVFFVKVTANGGSTAFFGPYTLNVGCSNDYVTYADNAAFVTSVSKLVGDDKASVYTFELPTTDRAYCQILTTEIVNADGSTWTGDAELSPTGSQP